MHGTDVTDSEGEPTVADVLRAAKLAAPGSIRVGRSIVTYHGEFPYWNNSDTNTRNE